MCAGDVPVRLLLGVPRMILIDLARSQTSPRQIAWGLALGATIGLMPKFSLAGIGIIFLTLCLPVNLVAAIVSTIAFTIIASLFGNVSQQVGEFFLTTEMTRQLIAQLCELPATAWLAFEDPNVLGRTVIAAGTLVPAYMTSRLVIRRYGETIDRYLSEFWVYREFLRARPALAGAAK